MGDGLVHNLFLLERFTYFPPAYTNNEINSEKTQNLKWFSAVVGAQHIVELTTFLSAPQILF